MKPLLTAGRTKRDLLPLPSADRDRIALECYGALCTLRSGLGTPDTIAALTNCLVTVHFMMAAGLGAAPESRSVFAAAQEAINECDPVAIAAGQCGAAKPEAADAIGALIALYERQLRVAPRAVVAEVVGRVAAYWGTAGGASGSPQRMAA